MNTPLTIQILVVLLGLAAQIGAFAFFLGRMRGGQDSLIGELAQFRAAMSGFQDYRLKAIGEAADVGARLEQVERNTDAVERLEKQFIRFEATQEAANKAEAAALDKLGRDVLALQSQMAALSRAGATEAAARALGAV